MYAILWPFNRDALYGGELRREKSWLRIIPVSKCSLKVLHERNSFQTWAKQHRWRSACPLPQSVRGRSDGRIRGNEYGLAHVHSTQYQLRKICSIKLRGVEHLKLNSENCWNACYNRSISSRAGSRDRKVQRLERKLVGGSEELPPKHGVTI